LRSPLTIGAAFAVATLLASAAGPTTAAVPTEGLVAHWSFDEGSGSTAADRSGNGHAGSLQYGATWAAAAQCKLGACVSLDGSDDYVRVLNKASLELTGDVTVAAWIKPAAVGSERTVVSKRYEFELGAIDDVAPHPLKWTHKAAGGAVVSGNLTTSTEASRWHHVVLVRDATAREIRGYEDGTPNVTGTYASPPATSTYNVNIGRNPGGGQHFKGLIDEVRVYGRALSPAEVQALYDEAGAPLPPDTQAPSTPTNLSASAISSSQVDLSWTASTDDRGVAGYRIYRDETQVGTSATASFRDGGLAPSTTYSYRVAAVDTAGNLSPRSTAVTATTPATTPEPTQREDVTLTNALTNPTAIGLAPDGRIFVAEQGGKLRVVKDGVLLPTPFLSVSVTSTNERGLLGVTFDPDFEENGWVYVYYTAASPVVNRVSRFTARASNPDVAEPGSEVVVFDNIPSKTGWHNGGAIHFGGDGRLYVAVGEGHSGTNAQSLDTVAGKLLRIEKDGSIPTDNPFYTTAIGQNRAIWALGLRNPFTFDIQPTGRIFVNDVGENAFEEINEAWIGPNNGTNAGFNFGWPETEGPHSDPRYKQPFHAYPQTSDCAITGGAFYDPATVNFPSEYVGDYFFADYCSGWIKSIDLTTKAVTTFIAADSARDPVDVKVAADGSLLYVGRGSNGGLHRVRYVGGSQAPSIVRHPQSATAPVGGSVTFDVSASGSPPLTYRWQRNGVDIAGATGPSYTVASVAAADDGARFRAVASNAHGTATSNEATLTVTTNTRPTAAIGQPAAGAVYAGGDTIVYAGSGTDAEDGNLAGSAFTWKVDFHHETHVHPFIPDTTGSTGGSFTVPTSGHTEADVWYRVYLTVTDSGGLSHTTYRDVLPRTATVTLDTAPSGRQLRLDAQPVTAPYTFTGVTGIVRSLSAPSPQGTYEFESWSDGGAQTHDVDTPSAATTYTATFRDTAPPPPPPPAGPALAVWSFDEGSGSVAADSAGGFDGTLTYGPAWASVVNCKRGACVSFDGDDDYVRVLDTPALKLTGDVTIAAWIKPTRLGAKQSLVSKRYEFELGPTEATSPYALGWSHKTSSGAAAGGRLVPSTELNAWQHVVLVRNAATKQMRGYKDGMPGLTTSYVTGPGTNTYNLNIGRNPAGLQHFAGLIDEVQIYDRALTDAEVSALYASYG
jgi:glucose/arabinose dehydrogenase